VALAVALAAGCGSSDGKTATDPSTELTWNGTPLAVTLAAGGSRLFRFVYPTNDGSPSAQFGAVAADPFDVYLCRVSDCGPSFPANSVTPKVTLQTGCEVSADCQIYDPVTPTSATTYWVHVRSAAGTSFTIWAAGT
jgi:hypothetical protein